MAVQWVCWYSDGSNFSSEDGPPEKAPRAGVLVVVQVDERLGFIPWFGWDYYCWENGGWIPHSVDGLTHYLDTCYPAIRLRGYFVRDGHFQDVFAQAVEDKRLPPRHAPHEAEVRFKSYLSTFYE